MQSSTNLEVGARCKSVQIVWISKHFTRWVFTSQVGVDTVENEPPNVFMKWVVPNRSRTRFRIGSGYTVPLPGCVVVWEGQGCASVGG